jgi:hypothetical protein
MITAQRRTFMKLKDILYYFIIFFVLWATTFCTRFIFDGTGIYGFASVFCILVFRTVLGIYLSAFFIGIISKNKLKPYWHVIVAVLTAVIVPAAIHLLDSVTYNWFHSGFELDHVIGEGIKLFLTRYNSYDSILPVLCEFAFSMGVYTLAYIGIKNRWVSAIANHFGCILEEDVATVKTNVISFPEDFDMNSPVVAVKSDGRLIVTSIDVYNTVMSYCDDITKLDVANDSENGIMQVLDGAVKAHMLTSREMIIPEEIRESVVSEEYEIIRFGKWWELAPFYIAE